MEQQEVYFSKTYTTTVNIPAGGVSNEEFIDEETWRALGPFDRVLIDIASDDVKLAVLPNGNTSNELKGVKGGPIAYGGQQFNTFQLKNLDSVNAHTAGKVTITVQNTKRPRRE